MYTNIDFYEHLTENVLFYIGQTRIIKTCLFIVPNFSRFTYTETTYQFKYSHTRFKISNNEHIHRFQNTNRTNVRVVANTQYS